MPTSLDEARTRVAAIWRNLAKVSEKVVADFQRLSRVVPGTGAYAVAHKQPHSLSAYHRFRDVERQMEAQGLDTTQTRRTRPPLWAGLGRHRQVEDTRRHHEAVKRDTEQVVKGTREKKRETEETRKQNEEVSRAARIGGIAGAVVGIGSRLFPQRAGATPAERGVGRFQDVNGAIAAAVTRLEMSRFRERVAIAGAVAPGVSERLDRQRQFEEESRNRYILMEQFENWLGSRFDDLKHALWAPFNKLSDYVIGEDKMKTAQERNAAIPGMPLLEFLRKGQLPDPAEPPADPGRAVQGAIIGAGIGLGVLP